MPSREMSGRSHDDQGPRSLGVDVCAVAGPWPPIPSGDDVVAVQRRAVLPDLRAVLGAELEKLSGDGLETLRLRMVEQLSDEDVARRLGVWERTVRARASRRLRAWSRALDRHEEVELWSLDASFVAHRPHGHAPRTRP